MSEDTQTGMAEGVETPVQPEAAPAEPATPEQPAHPEAPAEQPAEAPAA